MATDKLSKKPDDESIKLLQGYKEQIKEYKSLLFLIQNADPLGISFDLRQLLKDKMDEIEKSTSGWKSEKKKKEFGVVKEKSYKLEDFLPEELNPNRIVVHDVKRTGEEKWFDDKELSEKNGRYYKEYKESVFSHLFTDFNDFLRKTYPNFYHSKIKAQEKAELTNKENEAEYYQMKLKQAELKSKRDKYVSNLANWLDASSEKKLEILDNLSVNDTNILYIAIKTLMNYEQLYEQSKSLSVDADEPIEELKQPEQIIADEPFEATAFASILEYFTDMMKNYAALLDAGENREERLYVLLENMRNYIIDVYEPSQSNNPLYLILKDMDIKRKLKKIVRKTTDERKVMPNKNKTVIPRDTVEAAAENGELGALKYLNKRANPGTKAASIEANGGTREEYGL